MQIPFVGGAYEGRSKNINAQTCQNYYLELDRQDGNPLSLMNTPGCSLWCTPGNVAEVRGMFVWKSNLYAVIGNTLYRIDADAVATDVGTLSTSSGRVWIAAGTTHIALTDGTYGYYQTSAATSLTRITDTDFPTPSSLAYQDGYFIVTESGADSFYISGLEDAGSWDGLDFGSAEKSPDDALAVISDSRELIVAGRDTTEFFYNSGDVDFPFARIAGGVFSIGCGAVDSIAVSEEARFLLDNKYRVQLLSGYNWQQISTPSVEYHIQGYAHKSDARGYIYTQEGHLFYVLTFPHDSKTWCYDATTGIWHMRSSGLAGERHRSNCHAWFDGLNLVGDFENGNIYELDLGYYTDNGDTIIRKRAAQAVRNDRKKLFHHCLEIHFEAGVGLVTGQGSDPQVILRWSDDGGHTWSNEHWVGIGKIGKYKDRARWNKLGSSRDRVYEMSISDPVKSVIQGAYLDATPGIS